MISALFASHILGRLEIKKFMAALLSMTILRRRRKQARVAGSVGDNLNIYARKRCNKKYQKTIIVT
jgi:hypothetical protein